jgi:hypothetical protein
MQTADIAAINAAKSIGSSTHDRPMGPTLAQSGVVGRNPEPDGPLYSQIIDGVIHCRSCLLFHPKGIYARGLPHSRTFLGSNGAPERAGRMAIDHPLGSPARDPEG